MKMPEMVDIEIDDRGDLLAEKHDKVIIIDADTIVYAACAVCEYEVQVMGPDFMSEDEMMEARSMPRWDEATMTHMDIDPADALRHATDKLTLILDRIGGKIENVELHFTGGKDSFRYDLLRDAFPKDEEMHYKFKRKKKPTPVGLQAVKELMCKLPGLMFSQIWYDYEADDAVVLRKKQEGENGILCAIDKDVYKNVPGNHWNYYEADWYEVPIVMRWVETSDEDARFHQYLQAITGDKSDNIPGLKGIGPAKALKFIEPGMTNDELWEGVKAAYARHCTYGKPEDMALLNMELVNMHQLQDNMEIELWQP